MLCNGAKEHKSTFEKSHPRPNAFQTICGKRSGILFPICHRHAFVKNTKMNY